jgi:hypothetical protein
MTTSGRRRQRVVVTGDAGFLGSHLCERLLDEDYEVLCLDNFLTGTPGNVAHLLERGPFRLIRADVTDYVHIGGAVDAVLHFASPASPIDYLHLPIETLKVGSIGTLHTLGLAREKRALSAGFDLGGIRRSADPSAAGDLLGPRQSGRTSRCVRRGEAVRRGHDDGLSATRARSRPASWWGRAARSPSLPARKTTRPFASRTSPWLVTCSVGSRPSASTTASSARSSGSGRITSPYRRDRTRRGSSEKRVADNAARRDWLVPDLPVCGAWRCPVPAVGVLVLQRVPRP